MRHPVPVSKKFDDCLSAIDDMRDALRESLEKQWKTEQEKKQQMSALAHDIKTPLTIVREMQNYFQRLN